MYFNVYVLLKVLDGYVLFCKLYVYENWISMCCFMVLIIDVNCY